MELLAAKKVNQKKLRETIESAFNAGELQYELFFQLEIEYDDIEGNTRRAKITELIHFCIRHLRQEDLINACKFLRPNHEWNHIIDAATVSLETPEARNKHREETYQASRRIHLAHTVRPLASNYVSKSSKDKMWEISIYLVPDKKGDLSVIDYAEFYMGRHWSHNIFKAENQENFIGISTFAYGPFLCTCRLVFKDGKESMITRFIDFEMAKLFTQNIIADNERTALNYRKRHDLLDEMGNSFVGEELKGLAFELALDYENLPDDNQEMIRDLIVHFSSETDELQKLISLLEEKRPHIDWQKHLP